MDIMDKSQLLITTERFLVRLTRDVKELQQVLALRSSCFHRDFKMRDFETRADHLVVIDRITNQIVGAYRLTNSKWADSFETEEDFVFKKWLQTSGNKIELSWACTDVNYRQGVVIALLWRGLAEYLKIEKADYLFGPASLVNFEHSEVQQVLEYLRQNNYELIQDGIGVRLEKKWQLPNHNFIDSPSKSTSLRQRVLPALLRAYLMAGALVLLQPAFDDDTNCFDLMTVLDIEHCHKTIKGHFKI